ncbi:MAG: type 4a pilus biogenesis protein PilO [Gemmatimonadetes bacterium]|nr:type 4a pilus biogenesis protein PilO [Gemmatimonadota bacterium]
MAESMDPQKRKKILIGLLLFGGLMYLGYDYVYRPRAESVAALETRLETLELQNRTARALTAQNGTDEVERRVGLHREQLRRVEGLIPSSEELPDLLDAISAEARRAGVELARIQPMGATAEQFYTRRTYEIGVYGTYHQIGEFLSQVGSLPRIITPINLNLAVRGEQTTKGNPQLEARFSIETYVLPAEATRAE